MESKQFSEFLHKFGLKQNAGNLCIQSFSAPSKIESFENLKYILILSNLKFWIIYFIPMKVQINFLHWTSTNICNKLFKNVITAYIPKKIFHFDEIKMKSILQERKATFI